VRVTTLRLERVEAPLQRVLGLLIGAAIMIFGLALVGVIGSGWEPARAGSRSEVRGYLFVVIGVGVVVGMGFLFLRDVRLFPAAVCLVTRRRVILVAVALQRPVASLPRESAVALSSERHSQEVRNLILGRREKVWHTWRIGDERSEVHWTMGEQMRGSQARTWRDRLASVGVTTAPE
jgi:hypothetical protein